MQCAARLALALPLLGALATAAPAFAQVGRDVAERGSNRSQISKGKQAVERDTKEIEQYRSQLIALEDAVGKHDSEGANRALTALSPLMQTEIQQGTAQVEAAKKELAGSVSETGSNRRESRRNRDDSAAFGRSQDDEADAVRDGINRLDDTRDASDDKSDLEASSKRVQRQQQLASEVAGHPVALDSESGRHEAAEQIRKLKEFGQLMEQDLQATRQELKEDEKEAGEDRRETRDDAREADEPDNRYRRETGKPGRPRR